MRAERFGAAEIGAGDSVADDDHDRPGQLRASLQTWQFLERAVQQTAVTTPGILDNGNRRIFGEAARHQPLGDGGGDRASHINGDGCARQREPRPIRQHIAGKGDPSSRVGLTLQQALGMPVSSWGVTSMETSKPISEVL